ncbi:sugar transferase [Shinella zoogloeoides]|uniref:Sugar transferase n=1 Tax=Shinella zoogloeoides TaxID=352475 RepID=A0A6N8THK2_SHIZO|nr:sugar transferase [Shinella zoogloeoides]MXO02733.1 sugar transferase [Shinella zoogloeoides]UEX80989.1 sugar transferase [Shinella zoogloeoides]
MRELRSFVGPIAVTIGLQALIYVVITTRSGRNDWDNILGAIGALTCVPVLSAAILSAFRRHEAPVVAASIVSIGLFSVAVSVLSALRVPVSYLALLWCLPVVLAIIVYANIRFHRRLSARIVLAPFGRAADVVHELDEIPILSGPNADLGDAEIVLIDPHEHHSGPWSTFLANCYFGGVEIMPWTRYLEVRRGRLDITSFDITHLNYSPSQLLYARLKRGLDILGVIVTLPITLPMAALVALFLFLLDGNPVIFVQIRRGFGGHRFRMYKFRTMYKGSSGGSTSLGDTRIMPGCRLIRKLRFDELPQLFNILRGDMSLIGPRPVAEYVARTSEQAEPKYTLRSLVLPGITGWAQVTSGYAATTDEELQKLSYDLYYIKHLSFDLDLLVLFKTVRTVLLGAGAR